MGNGELPSTGRRWWAPSSALSFLCTPWPQYSLGSHCSYFQTGLWVPVHTKARDQITPTTSLCPGSADFCSWRTDKPPSPAPLEPQLMGSWPAPGHRVTLTSPLGPLLALLMDGGKVPLDPCVSVVSLGRTATVGDLGWGEGSAFATQCPWTPRAACTKAGLWLLLPLAALPWRLGRRTRVQENGQSEVVDLFLPSSINRTNPFGFSFIFSCVVSIVFSFLLLKCLKWLLGLPHILLR